MLKEFQPGFAAIAVTLLTSALIVLDLDAGVFRRWWAGHALTTDTVAGILVLLITVLIVNQMLSLRQQRARSRATAAQIGVVLGQAVRATRAVVSSGDSTDRETARDEVRTYMTMLMIASPILIEAKPPRAFLERAQVLGGQLVRTLGLNPLPRNGQQAAPSPAKLQRALRELTIAAGPLLSPLTAEESSAVRGEQTT